MDNKQTMYLPKVLFLGNGVNKAFGECSWDEVIDKLSTGEFDYDQKTLDQIKKLPYALQTIVFSSDSVSDGMKMISEGLLPHKLKSDHLDLIKEFTSLPFDAILTPNYSYEVEMALEPDFDVKQGCSCKYRHNVSRETNKKDQFGLYRFYDINDKKVWHIHGEAALINSMVMGHYYYGKLLKAVQERVPDIIKSYKTAQKYGKAYKYDSWVDYFLLSDVHIVGFGMDPSEMDIWWLVNAKKRHFSEFGNIYFHEPNLMKEEKAATRVLVELFGIKYDEVKVKGTKRFIEYYYSIADELRHI